MNRRVGSHSFVLPTLARRLKVVKSLRGVAERAALGANFEDQDGGERHRESGGEPDAYGHELASQPPA